MIKAFLMDARALTLECAEKIIDATPALAGVITAKEKSRRLESAAAYMLLSFAVRSLGYGALPRVLRADGGKPYFEDSDISFSLSHRPGAALAFISDEGEVGADIELIKEPDRMAKMAERYLSGIEASAENAPDIDVLVCDVSESGEIKLVRENADFVNKNLHISRKCAPDTPYLGWTMLEAALKIGGGGFSDYPRVGEIIPTLAAAHYEAKIGDLEYAITLATRV